MLTTSRQQLWTQHLAALACHLSNVAHELLTTTDESKHFRLRQELDTTLREIANAKSYIS